MSDQEIVATAETQAETSTLFDELAGLVPEERLTEYYRVIAHTRTLSPNDEMLNTGSNGRPRAPHARDAHGDRGGAQPNTGDSGNLGNSSQ